MRLLIYEKFWDSFFKLNKDTQRKVIDFQQKFREHSTAASLHLEPISTFKDKSLRTARIDQKYRAIIKAPKTGVVYYLLHVGNHDEAMDWARNKVIDWNETTQAMQIYTVPGAESDMPIVEEPLPKEDQSLLAPYSDEQLIAIGVPKVLLASVRQIQSIDDLEQLESYIPSDTFEHLFYLLDGVEIERLIEEIKDGLINVQDPEQQAGSLNNQRSFIELTDDEDFNEILSGSLDKWKYYLHPSQRKLVDKSFNGPVKVTGGAGTGKTVVALHRLKHLSQSATVDQPALFTTYTKALTQNLEQLANELRIPSNKIQITNIDHLVRKIAQEHRLIASHQKVMGWDKVKNPSDLWEELLDQELIEYDRDFLEKEFSQIVLYHNIQDRKSYFNIPRQGRGKGLSRRQRAAVWEVFEKYMALKKKYGLLHKEELYNLVTNHLTSLSLKPFSAVVADELQDLSNVELRFLRSLVEEKPNDMFLVGDPFQSIYQRKINFTQAGIKVRGKRSTKLRINYRTTEEIKKLAISIIKEVSYDNFDGEAENLNGYVSLFHGVRPVYQIFKSKQEELEAIQTKIEELVNHQSKYSYADLAIACRTANSLKEVKDLLHQHKIPYYESHSKRKGGDQQGIWITTFHSIKGLEFKHVILVDVNHRSCPLLFHGFHDLEDHFKARHLQAERSLLYVASTRAIESLTISGIGTKSDFVQL